MYRLTISNKLWIFLITPIFTLCFLTVQLLQEKYQELTIQQQMFHAVDLSDIYTELLYSLQKERAFSLSKLTINSLKYDPTKLVNARSRTDKVILKIIKETDKESQLNDGYLVYFKEVTKKLANLKKIRHDVDLHIKSTHIAYYSHLNTQLINSISTLYSIGDYFGYSLLASAYLNSLRIEEFSHQESIAIIDIFERGTLNSDRYKNFMSIISHQSGAINSFFNVASPSYKNILQQILKKDAHKYILIHHDFIACQVDKKNLLISLYEVIGYGGLIHNFKNYLLRGKPEDAIKVKYKAKLAKQLIQEFADTHDKSLTTESFLGNALKMIELYESRVKVITMMKKNNHVITEIDKAVSIYDQPLIKAIAWLHFDKSFFDEAQWNNEFDKKIVEVNDLSREIRSALQEKIILKIQQIKISIYQLILGLIVVLLFSFVIGYQLKNRLVNEIKFIVTFMRQCLKRDEEKYFEIAGNDEISQMKQAFNELRKQQTENGKNLKLASQVFFSAHEGICIADSKGKIVDINPAFSKITGYNKAEIIADDLKRFTHDRQSFRNNDIWGKLISDGYWKGEVRSQTKSGSLLIEKLTILAVNNKQGEVSHYIGMFSDITESKRILKRLEEMAYHDSLTKLPNRALLNERFNLSQAYSKREECHIAVCYIDLNKFKPVNDTYGHDIGDLLLFEFSERLKACIRERDTVARIGGDEFALLLSSVKEYSEFEAVLNRILHSTNQPFIIKGHHIHVSASIGVSVYPEHGDNLELLLKLADKAMFQSKYSEDHHYTFYDPTIKNGDSGE